MGRLAVRYLFQRAVATAGFSLLAAWLLCGCPRMGDPHLETGFRVGPLSNVQEEAVLHALGIGPSSPVAPKGAFLWGGKPPSGPEECSRTTAYLIDRHDDIIVRTLGCGSKNYVFMFFTGLEANFKSSGTAPCSFLETRLKLVREALDANRGDSEVQWWSQGPTDRRPTAIGCAGGTLVAPAEPRF